MTWVSSSIFASLFPSWPLLALLLLLALLFSFHREHWPGGASFPGQVEGEPPPPGRGGSQDAVLGHIPGLSGRDRAFPAPPAGSGGWGRLEPARDGARAGQRGEQRDRDKGHEAGGWNVPARGSSGSPGSGEIPWAGDMGLDLGMRGGDAQWDPGWALLPGEPRERGAVPGAWRSLQGTQGCCGWEQGLNESCRALIGSVCSQLSVAPESQPAPLCLHYF